MAAEIASICVSANAVTVTAPDGAVTVELLMVANRLPPIEFSATVAAIENETAAVLLAAIEAATVTISALIPEVSSAVTTTGPFAVTPLPTMLASSVLVRMLRAITPDMAPEPAKLLLPATENPIASESASIALSALADTVTPPPCASTLELSMVAR